MSVVVPQAIGISLCDNSSITFFIHKTKSSDIDIAVHKDRKRKKTTVVQLNIRRIILLSAQQIQNNSCLSPH